MQPSNSEAGYIVNRIIIPLFVVSIWLLSGDDVDMVSTPMPRPIVSIADAPAEGRTLEEKLGFMEKLAGEYMDRRRR